MSSNLFEREPLGAATWTSASFVQKETRTMTAQDLYNLHVKPFVLVYPKAGKIIAPMLSTWLYHFRGAQINDQVGSYRLWVGDSFATNFYGSSVNSLTFGNDDRLTALDVLSLVVSGTGGDPALGLEKPYAISFADGQITGSGSGSITATTYYALLDTA